MLIQTFAFPNYYAIVLAVGNVSACAQLKIFVVKPGSTCENKRIFNFKLSKKFSEAHRNISILKIPLCDTNS